MTNSFEIKQRLKKVWHFLWKDESVWSWIVSLALAFVIVKFIFYPVLSLIFVSPMPLVVVESHSMLHQGSFFKTLTGVPIFSQDSFDQWWEKNKVWYERRSIQIDETEDWHLKSGLDKGDIIILRGTDNLEVGDIIVFNAKSQTQRYPVIHRIVTIRDLQGETIYETKGDNNADQIPFERNIKQEDIIGKAVLKVPKLGWIKLIFVEIIRFFFPRLI